jgi:limonene-1,2-epoxide hydrolase
MTNPPASPDLAATTVARSFLELLQAGDLDRALDLLADDVVYTNVSLPAIRGRRDVERAFRATLGRMSFRVHFHAVGCDENDSSVVLTERTDALVFGPVIVQFWVYGRFEVRDGRITVWRDSFDWGDVLMGLARGVAGAAVPAVRRSWPEIHDSELR